MKIVIGSARMGENGRITGGKAGDQKQKSASRDFSGEVSMQNFYVHKKGWYIIRPKSYAHAIAIGNAMVSACNNINIGYNQTDRLGVIKYGINTTVKTNADCGTLVRACVIAATGKDPGNFTTANEINALSKTGLFETKIPYSSSVPLYVGDILVTKTKGHTAIVTESEYKRSPNQQNTVTSTATGVVGAINNAITNSTGNKKSNLEIAKEVIQGKWGIGVARKNALTKAGYDYGEIQKQVNKLLN